ncbi:MAG: FGGY family carbohydrate kinase, partial [Thermoanaerobaculia bacterium]|nr:FGGY family carbohydrate kinase [Thermoanaerobaculia bacterium]
MDQGSSSTKGALIGDEGRILNRIEIPVSSRGSGLRVEQDPEEIGSSVERVLSRLEEESPIDALGLTCQRSTCLLWDRETAEPLTPALSWRDRREAERVDALADHAAVVA